MSETSNGPNADALASMTTSGGKQAQHAKQQLRHVLNPVKNKLGKLVHPSTPKRRGTAFERIGAFAKVNKDVYDKVLHKAAGPFHLGTVLAETENQQDDMDIPGVAPDMILQNMDIVIRKVLKGVTVREYYETIWSEGVNTDTEPFYGPWLADGGKNKVNVEDWSFADLANEFEGWHGEKYPQKRVVDIEFVRTTHLYAGPPVIHVKHTQYCRMEENDRCILSMMIEIKEGIPLADCFNVQLRWVATRVGTNDVLMELGLVVVFVKSSMLASQIRAGAKEETIKGQMNLFENIAAACNAHVVESEREMDELEPLAAETCSCSRLGNFLSRLFRQGGILADRNDDVACGVRTVDEKLRAVISTLEKSNSHVESETEILDELASATSCLEQVLSRLS